LRRRPQDQGPWTQDDPGQRTQAREPRTEDPGQWTQDSRPRTKDLGQRTKDPGQGTQDMGTRTGYPGLRTEDQARIGLRTEHWESRTADESQP